MQAKKINIGISDFLLTAITLLFLIGSFTFLSPCPAKEDGSWMNCHWAGQAISGLAAVLLVISLIHLFAPDPKVKLGLSLSMIPTALLAAILPGNLITLCMMESMRCHTTMRPLTIIISVLVILLALIDTFLQTRKNRRK